jgi:hypothetical protein
MIRAVRGKTATTGSTRWELCSHTVLARVSGRASDYRHVPAVQLRPAPHVVPQQGLPRPPHARQYDVIPLSTHVSAGSAHVVVHWSPGWPRVPALLFRQERSDPPKQSSAAFAHAGIVEQQGWPGCPQASHCDAMSTTTHVLPALHDVPQHGCPEAPHIDAEQIPATHETPGRQSMPGQHASSAPPHGGALSTTSTGEDVSFAPSSLEASPAGPVLLASPVAPSAPPSALALPPSSAAVTEPPQAAISAKPKAIAKRELMTAKSISNATHPSAEEPDGPYPGAPLHVTRATMRPHRRAHRP